MTNIEKLIRLKFTSGNLVQVPMITITREEYESAIEKDHQEWTEEITKNCNCCTACNQEVPCGGVKSGGLCDDLCNCGGWYHEK